MTFNFAVYGKREEKRIEAVIQQLRDERLAELKESKQRACEDSQAFSSLLQRVEDQLRVTVDPAAPSAAVTGVCTGPVSAADRLRAGRRCPRSGTSGVRPE